MNTTLVIAALALIPGAFTAPPDFLAEQKKFEKVRTAFAEKGDAIEQTLAQHGLESGDLNVLISVYKDDDELEVYGKKKTDAVYKKLASYRICSRSGQLGPKRKEGDYQVPEGFYHINMFNPASNFYLSLGINYPNLSDKRKSKATHLGGSIFIHGACVTIGCIPMTDERIKEIYLYAVHARNNGQVRIPVYIFPFRMTDENFPGYKTRYSANADLVGFWANMKTGYDLFMDGKKELNVSVDTMGNYQF